MVVSSSYYYSFSSFCLLFLLFFLLLLSVLFLSLSSCLFAVVPLVWFFCLLYVSQINIGLALLVDDVDVQLLSLGKDDARKLKSCTNDRFMSFRHV